MRRSRFFTALRNILKNALMSFASIISVAFTLIMLGLVLLMLINAQYATEKVGEHSKVLHFERPIPAREVGLVYRRKQYKADLIESLAESILESIPEHVRKIRAKDLEVLPVHN